jgi:deoxyribodipyrimidine photo-lyase
MSRKKCLLWFHRDLRVHDNPIINWAATNECDVVAVTFMPTTKAPIAQAFHEQAIQDLKARFDQQGIGFFVLRGSPETQLPTWVEKNSIDLVLTQMSFNSRDQISLQKLTEQIGEDRILTFRHQTLIGLDQLPFEIEDLPLVFTPFRKLIEKNVAFKLPLSSCLDQLSGFQSGVPEGSIPTSFGTIDQAQHFPFDLAPGETGALDRLDEYFWKTQSVAHYKETRNGMLNKNDSSKFSPYLALGCLSPRRILQDLLRFEQKYGKNESTEWLVFELMWRDYFKFLALKIGPKLFAQQGLSTQIKNWDKSPKVFRNWIDGETQARLVDANMNELRITGWMSNRGRQNVASYLSKTLNFDWTLGAKYFEENLIDDDPESNWGNWMYVAGVGTDPRDRIFNIERQTEMYDPYLEYCNKWLTQQKFDE